MTRLVLINGAPAAGKSTLARRYADEHELTLVLDIDRVRGMLGRWVDHPNEAGLRARALAIAMARTHLQAGFEVVVPQFLGRLEFVITLADLADELACEFVEIVLLSSADEAAARFDRRSTHSADPDHRAAADLLRGQGSPMSELYQQLLDVVAARPATRVVTSRDADEDGAYAALVRALAEQ